MQTNKKLSIFREPFKFTSSLRIQIPSTHCRAGQKVRVCLTTYYYCTNASSLFVSKRWIAVIVVDRITVSVY